MMNSKCKICRRLGVKLFLKGEKCLSPKCPMVRRSYPPGQRGKRRSSSLSEYGKELREKQKLKNWYNLEERQFGKYVREALRSQRKVEDVAGFLIKVLESRLDNIIFRLGITSSRAQARQLVLHGYFLINGKSINIPSYQVKKGDIISIKPQKIARFKGSQAGQNLQNLLKKYKAPSWLELNPEKLEGKIIGEPILEEVIPPVEILAVFEYYSR